MKIYKLTFDNKQDFIDKTAHLRIQHPCEQDEEVDVSTLSWNENVHSIVEGITVITGYNEETEEPIYSDKYHVDMILSEPSGMEQYIDSAITQGHYAHSFVGCSFEVVQPLQD